MAKKLPAVVAAGAVVLRHHGREPEVLVVHRPAYDDWSLPKGKQYPDEDLQVTAARETQEETGYQVRLGRPLPKVTYSVSKGRKDVHWWVGYLVDEMAPPATLDSEVDQARWLDFPTAHRLLSYDDEHELIDQARVTPSSGTIVVVRHAKAMQRKHWTGKDWLRPLTSRGKRQADRLVPLLNAYGVDATLSSTSTRCVQTLRPYTKNQGLALDTDYLLSEEGAKEHHEDVDELMWQLRVSAITPAVGAIAVCGHRPVLPAMLAGLHLEPTAMSPAQCLIAHLDADSEPVAVESIKPAF